MVETVGSGQTNNLVYSWTEIIHWWAQHQKALKTPEDKHGWSQNPFVGQEKPLDNMETSQEHWRM